jgi:uncharacterized protein YbaP (TraB family)
MARRRISVWCYLLLAACWVLQPGWSAKPGGSPVWQVSGERNQVFLLGSIHLLRQDDYPLPAAIDRAYVEAESIVMEIDLDDMDPFSAQGMVRELGVLPAGQSLELLMGPERYAGVEAAAGILDIPLELLQQSRPWLAAVTVEQLLLTRIGFAPELGVETYIMERAVSDGKAITGLETLRQQFEFLASLSLDAQYQLLMQTLEAKQDIEQQMDALVLAWRNGDSAYLEAKLLSEIEHYEELYTVIVSERNRRWAEQIAELLDDEQDYLVVVGSMHLVGEDGVPALLAGKELQVRQVAGEDAGGN